MNSVSAIRTLALQGSTIIDVSICMQVIRQDHVWLLGDDDSTIAAVAADLKALADVIAAGYRDDLEIRTEATRLVRILERRANRDFGSGLLDIEPCEFMPLLYADEYDSLGDMDPIPMGTYAVVPTSVETGTSATGGSFVAIRSNAKAA
jgi:hypothetical protein